MRSLSENIAQIIKKQSSRPGAKLNDIITYQDLNNPLVYDCMKYTMDLIKQQNLGKVNKSQEKINYEKYGTTVYDLLRYCKSEPEDVNNTGDDTHEAVTEDQTTIIHVDDLSDEGRDVKRSFGTISMDQLDFD